MKMRLTRSNKIDGKSGEIVEVSPARAAFLLRYGMAEPVTVREQAETPEKKTAVKSTRTAKAEPVKAESVKKEAKTAKAAGKKK